MASEPASAAQPSAEPARRLFGATSAAVFGASDRTLLHRTAMQSITRWLPSRTVAVNPSMPDVPGVRSYARARDIGRPVDLALMLVGDEYLRSAVADALAAGIRTLVVPGLSAGPRDEPEIQWLARRAEEAGAVVLGPNCMGAVIPGGLSPWLGTLPGELRTGGVAMASHSGAVAEAIVGLGPRLGLRAVVSLGREISLDVADLLAFFATDPGTSCVGLFLETVRRPDALVAAMRALRTAGKPVICLKVGRSIAAREVTRGHTGADAGSHAAFLDIAAQGGVTVVDDYCELVECLALLDAPRWPTGPRVGAVTTSGGQAALLADQALLAGIPFRPPSTSLAAALREASPAGLSGCNPLDAWCAADTEGTFARALGRMAASGEFDLLVAHVDQTPHIGAFERETGAMLAHALATACRSSGLPGALLSSQASEDVPEVSAIARQYGLAMLRASGAGVRALAAVSVSVASSGPVTPDPLLGVPHEEPARCRR